MNDRMNIFVDCDAFVAIVRDDDSNHVRALEFMESLIAQGAVFSTSNYVFAEAVTVISQRVGKAIAMEYIRRMNAPDSPYSVVWIDERIHNHAIELFSRQTSKNTSFVDCANMAVMLDQSVDAIFSFDDVYRKNGFTLVEDFVRT